MQQLFIGYKKKKTITTKKTQIEKPVNGFYKLYAMFSKSPTVQQFRSFHCGTTLHLTDVNIQEYPLHCFQQNK